MSDSITAFYIYSSEPLSYSILLNVLHKQFFRKLWQQNTACGLFPKMNLNPIIPTFPLPFHDTEALNFESTLLKRIFHFGNTPVALGINNLAGVREPSNSNSSHCNQMRYICRLSFSPRQSEKPTSNTYSIQWEIPVQKTLSRGRVLRRGS